MSIHETVSEKAWNKRIFIFIYFIYYFKILYSAALWYSDWRILPGQSLPHEELCRSVIIFMIQEFKILRYVLQPEIRITGLSLSGSSLQCGGVQGLWVCLNRRHVLARSAFLGVLTWQAEFRILLEQKFFLNLRCTFLRTYNVHCDAYILKIYFVSVFFRLWKGGMGHLNPYKAYHRRIPDPEIVTLHRRSNSKRVYGPQAFLLKLSLTAMIKSIKNKSRSYQKLMIYRLDTLLTLDFLVAIPL